MSDTPSAVPEELQVLAGEYVLGVLDAAEMRAVRRRSMADPAFAAVIGEWERRLAPMVNAIGLSAPPDALWERIEQAIAPLAETEDEPQVSPAARPLRADGGLGQADPPRVEHVPLRAIPLVDPDAEQPLMPRLRAATAGVPPEPSVWPWKLGTALSLALAAGIAAFTIVPTVATRLGLQQAAVPVTPATTGAPPQVAALMPPHTDGFLAEAQPNGTVLLTALTTVPVPNGRDLELWILPPGQKVPTSLGLLPAVGKRITLKGMPVAGTQLMVSMEPAGGSPTGAPTGPVVYAGSLDQLSL